MARGRADWRERRAERTADTQAGPTDVMSSYPEEDEDFEPTVSLAEEEDDDFDPAIFNADTSDFAAEDPPGRARAGARAPRAGAAVPAGGGAGAGLDPDGEPARRHHLRGEELPAAEPAGSRTRQRQQG